MILARALQQELQQCIVVNNNYEPIDGNGNVIEWKEWFRVKSIRDN
jgi:hypothetical protein